MRAWLATAIVMVGVLCGCGSNNARLRPAPEPPNSPPLATRPQGTVTAVGKDPEGIVVDRNGEVVVATRDPDLLSIIDPRSARVLRRASLDASARHLGLSDAGLVLVPAERANRVEAFDPQTAQAVASVPVGTSPHDAAVAAGRWFISDEFNDRVSVVQDGREIGRVPVAAQPGGIAVSDDQVAVVSVRARQLQTLDSHTLRSPGSTQAGVGPTHVVCAGAGLCFVADTEGNALLVYSLNPRPVLTARLPLPGGPYGLALDTTRARLWVTLPGLNQVAEIAANRQPVELGRFATVRQPNSVAVDLRSGRVFVAGLLAVRADGVVETVDAQTQGIQKR